MKDVWGRKRKTDRCVSKEQKRNRGQDGGDDSGDKWEYREGGGELVRDDEGNIQQMAGRTEGKGQSRTGAEQKKEQRKLMN